MGTLYSVDGITGDILTAGSITSTSITKGFLPPVLTTTQRNAIASPITGYEIFNSTTNQPEFYNGATWSSMGSLPAGSSGQVQFNSGGIFGASPNLAFSGFTLTVLNGANGGAVNVGHTHVQEGSLLLNGGTGTNYPTLVWQDFSNNNLWNAGLTFGADNWYLNYNSNVNLLTASFANNNLSIGTNSIAAVSSLLDLTSTTKGFLPPRMTTTQRNAISSPATGLEIFNTTTAQPEVYNGSAWVAMGATPPGGSSGQMQYNSSGAFAGASGVTTDGTNLTMGTGGSVVLTTPLLNGTGGTLTLTTGNNTNPTNGGGITLTCGLSDSLETSGSILITTTNGGNGGANGGSITLTTGSGAGNNQGGSLTLTSGSASGTSSGGSISLTAATPANGGSITLTGTGTHGIISLANLIDWTSTSAPSVSASSHGRIYFDSTANKFEVSENAGAYIPLLPSAGTGVSISASNVVSIGQSVATSASPSFAGLTITSTTPVSTYSFDPASRAITLTTALNNSALTFNTTTGNGGAGLAYNAANITVSTGNCLGSGTTTMNGGGLTFTTGNFNFTGTNTIVGGGITLTTGAMAATGTNVVTGGGITLTTGNSNGGTENGGGITLTSFTPSNGGSLTLTGTGTKGILSLANLIDWTGTSAPAVSASGHGRIYFDSGTNTFQASQNGGAYASLGAGITQLTGDVTAGPGSGSQASTLATVNSNVGSFTSANITVNAKGLITAASNGTPGGVTSITGTTNQVIASASTGAVTLSLPQSINVGATPTFASETLTATTNQLTLGTTNTTTISSTAPSASRTVTLPDAGANSSFVLTESAQTINGVKTFGKVPVLPNTSSSATSITPDATVSAVVLISGLTGTTTINGPTGGYDGQRLTFRIIQGGTPQTVTFASGSGNFRFGTDLPSYTSSGANLTDYIGVLFNSSASRWDIVSIIQGF